MSRFSDTPFLHKTITPLALVQKCPICSIDLYSESADEPFYTSGEIWVKQINEK